MKFIMLFCAAVIGTISLAETKDDWDFFVFTRAWPFSFCTVNNDCKHENLLQPQFNTHGLWPNGNNGSEPAYCHGGNKFDVSKLKPIMAQLNKTWMDLKDPEHLAKNFWKSEYEKHGTCAASETRYETVLEYFSAGVKLYGDTDPKTILTRGGIVPGSAYSPKEIFKVLQNEIKHNPQITCEVKDDIQYLLEIRFCYTKELKLRDCLPLQQRSNFRLRGRNLRANPCSEKKPVNYPKKVQKKIRSRNLYYQG